METSIYEIGNLEDIFAGHIPAMLRSSGSPADHSGPGNLLSEGWFDDSAGYLESSLPPEDLQDSLGPEYTADVDNLTPPSYSIKKYTFPSSGDYWNYSESADVESIFFNEDDDVSCYSSAVESSNSIPCSDFPLKQINNETIKIQGSLLHLIDQDPFGVICTQGEHEKSVGSKVRVENYLKPLGGDLDAFGCDESDVLHDPVSVCKLLNQLNEVQEIGLCHSPVLSPVSPEEVDSVLSQVSFSEAPSEIRILSDDVPDPQDLFSDSQQYEIISQEYLRGGLVTKAMHSYSFADSDPNTRKQKKKEQNKTAALRYRKRKREEKGVVLTEVEELEQKNAALKTRADDLTREINYLKALLDEIKSE